MIFQAIWERYFLREFLKIFFFFLACFYGLYVLIDYASHTSALPHHTTQIRGLELGRYYLFIFASRAEILIPLALLIALIKTLCTLNVNGELVALMAGGFRLKTLIRPFLLMGLAATLLMYLNEEWVLPHALKKLRRIEDVTKHQKRRHKPQMTAHHLVLEDGSIFIYQTFDTAKEQFFDAFWMPHIDELYRMKYVSPQLQTGYYVDHLVRQSNGELALADSFKELYLPQIRFNREILQSTLVDPDALSIVDLWQEKPAGKDADLSEKESKIMAAFYWKLLMPWLCLLAILAPIPYCVYFSRQFPLFLIYVVGIFGLIAFYFFMDAALVVAKRQVVGPFWALLVPFLGTFGLFLWKLRKI